MGETDAPKQGPFLVGRPGLIPRFFLDFLWGNLWGKMIGIDRIQSEQNGRHTKTTRETRCFEGYKSR